MLEASNSRGRPQKLGSGFDVPDDIMDLRSAKIRTRQISKPIRPIERP